MFSKIAIAFEQGGFWMWPILVVGLGTLGVAIAHAVSALRETWIAGICLVGVLVLLGLVGTIHGIVTTFNAVAAVAPEHKTAILARGIDESSHNGWLAGILAGLALGPFIAGEVRRPLRRRGGS